MWDNILIALAASFGWLVKDFIHDGKTFSINANWKKYVGCLIAGTAFGALSGVKFFSYIAEIGVIVLVANFFEAVVTAINWILSKVGSKAKV